MTHFYFEDLQKGFLSEVTLEKAESILKNMAYHYDHAVQAYEYLYFLYAKEASEKDKYYADTIYISFENDVVSVVVQSEDNEYEI